MDTDQLIQDEAGMTIEEMVAERGWAWFRSMEEEVLAQTALVKHLVVATGGGAVLSEASRKILKDSFFLTVYLKTSPEQVLKRLAESPVSGQRPPLSDLSLEEEVKNNLAQREPLYLDCADLILDAGKPPELNAGKIIAAFQAQSRPAIRS